jgi:hypothetical protein
VNSQATQGYFAWGLEEQLLVLPKILGLPMVTPPTDWICTGDGAIKSGGYCLAEFSNMTYRGHIEGRSNRTHGHNLIVKEIAHINRLLSRGGIFCKRRTSKLFKEIQ